LALNLTWLLGFYSFLLGGVLFPVTLGVWWSGRERPGGGWAATLAALMVLGYFAHLVSLGLTVVGLVVLAVMTPGANRRGRWAWTGAALLPLVPLGLVYRRLMTGGGAVRPIWGVLQEGIGSADVWSRQMGWIDPLTLGRKTALPFVAMPRAWFGLFAPIFWFSLALAALAAAIVWPAAGRLDSAASASRHERRGWAVLAALLLLGGLAGPDTLGPGHGNYLPQRLFLLGLVALVPVWELDGKRPLVRLAALLLTGALVVQSAYVWDYALISDRRAGAIARAVPAVGRNMRVGTLLIGIQGPYRANPILHVDNQLGIGTGNIVWNNYETAHYYFPVQFRPDLRHPPAFVFEEVAIRDDPADAPERARLWEQLLQEYHDLLDVLVVWGSDPRLDGITARWFDPEPMYDDGWVRVLRRRGR
ncbi:MAG: hypothetical protein IRY99_27025, partial [Isosphaeraceae bacterium]|nr:hypothetical protein [Isosphaeraceae bacterium]